MKIYQLHEYSGEWEDYRDYIIGSYLRKERAEEEKVKAKERELKLRKKHSKCVNCPFLDGDWEDKDELLKKHMNYCGEVDLEDCRPFTMGCKNYFSKWDESSFKIKEVEVEE